MVIMITTPSPCHQNIKQIYLLHQSYLQSQLDYIDSVREDYDIRGKRDDKREGWFVCNCPSLYIM